MLINGTYPGPLLRGNWGDWFSITVINNLTNCNGTSIHWHGIRQWNTVWADGVAGVTQCPISVCIPNLPNAFYFTCTILFVESLALQAALCVQKLQANTNVYYVISHSLVTDLPTDGVRPNTAQAGTTGMLSLFHSIALQIC